jgi:aminopeptidase YwaD
MGVPVWFDQARGLRMGLVRLRWMVALLLALAPVALRGQQGWVVRPEWVRAHEEFLASDVMAGRGSATRDEEITATYVASEFMGYGLKPAPGMSGYIQTAEIVAPVLDGRATLTAGGVRLEEGQGWSLLSSTGASAHGPLRKVAIADLAGARGLKGAVVLVTGAKGLEAYRAARQSGAAVLVLVENDGTRAMAARLGGKTRVSMHLAGAAQDGLTIAAVNAETAAKLGKVQDGAEVEVAVHPVASAGPRYTYNAMGYLEGSEPGSGTILLTAHLDHLGIAAPVNGDSIYNGANDDAAGTTAVLELAHALAAGPRLRRNVLFVCYGSEELGGLGSTYFGEHSPVPLASLVANLEFEMIGAQDPKMPKGVLLLTGWERSNLGPVLKAHGALLGPDPYPEQHFFERSDNYSLALEGVVAHTAAGWGTVPTYHQPDDDLAHLDLPFMTAAIQSLVEPVRWLAESDFRPQWNPGGKREGR